MQSQDTANQNIRPTMCYFIVERYSVCRCLYYRHDIDRCSKYGQEGHRPLEKTILVGYACHEHQGGQSPPESQDPVEVIGISDIQVPDVQISITDLSHPSHSNPNFATGSEVQDSGYGTATVNHEPSEKLHQVLPTNASSAPCITADNNELPEKSQELTEDPNIIDETGDHNNNPSSYLDDLKTRVLSPQAYLDSIIELEYECCRNSSIDIYGSKKSVPTGLSRQYDPFYSVPRIWGIWNC